MRRVLFVAALFALLAGCSLKSPEGAACTLVGESTQCPTGQRCGADGVCSIAANECGDICTASSCSGPAGDETLSRCDQSGACASLTTVPCGAHETCDDGAGQCVCTQSAECEAQGTSCLTGTRLRTCDAEGLCPFLVGDRDCNAGEDCVGNFPTAQCKCPDAGPGLDEGCSQAGLEKCDGLAMHTCRERAPGSTCLTWQLVKTCSSGLECRPGQDGACVCPDHQETPPVLLVDKDAGPVDGAEPNGADPLACRFKTLQAALDRARTGEIVKMTGAGPTVTIPGPPAVVRDGITLVGDDSLPPVPANAVFVVEGTGTTGMTVEAGGSVSGLTVRKGATADALVGVEVSGASPVGKDSLTSVVVDDAGGAFEAGIKITGSGDVRLATIGVAGASQVGLLVARQAGDQAVQVADASIDGKAAVPGPSIGIKAENGTVELVRPRVKLSSGPGISASPTVGGLVRLGVREAQVHDNLGTGILAQRVAAIRVTDSYICNNAGGLPRTIDTESRLIGGLYLDGAAPGVAADQVFTGNRIFSNAGDQIAVGLGAGTWNLDGQSSAGTCTSGRNAVSGYVAGSFGLVAASNVNARFNGWANVPPQVGTDVHPIGAPTVKIGTEGGLSEYCSLPVELTCPTP